MPSQVLEANIMTSRFAKTSGRSRSFSFWKRTFDIAMSILLVPVLIGVALLLLVANPYYNKGRLFYTQTRMGRNCVPFTAYKFRSMIDVTTIARGANDGLELDRITRLGAFLRKSRIDELPQIINVLKGEMSLIGPRPDYYEHAVTFLDQVHGYRERHMVRPGISGLAQIRLGYIQGIQATRRKVRSDLFYIDNASFRLEAWLFWQTLTIVARRAGA